MGYNQNELALFREQIVFVKKEAVSGVLEYPAAADSILISGDGLQLPSQNPSYTNSPEISNTRGILARTPDMYPPGKWGFGTLIRPSGVAGTPPLHDVLFEAWGGKKTVNAGASVIYSPIIAGKSSFSLWWRVGHTVFFSRYCTATDLGLSVTNKGYPTLKWSGEFAQLGWAGKNQLSAAAAQAATEIHVDDASHFCVGGMVENITDNDDNAGAGYVIDAVDYTNNTITLHAGVVIAGGWTDNAEIAGFLPAPAVPTSYPVVSKNTICHIDDVASTIRSVDLTLTDPLQFITDEITVSNFPEDALEGDRALKGTLKLTFREKELARFYDGYNTDSTNKFDIIFNNGTAGKQVTFEYKKAKLDIPTVNGDKPAITLDVNMTGLEDQGEDSFSVTFA